MIKGLKVKGPLIGALITIFSTTSFAEEVRIGTTFSPVQCEYLGLDWKKTYEETLDMGFKIVRLGAYWNRIEKKEGEYDYTELDWQIEKAKEKNIGIVVSVGMKAPRWPEYYIPAWVEGRNSIPYGGDVSKNAFLRKKTLLFIKTTVERYRKESALIAWQVENEAANRIGEKKWYIGKDFLNEEVRVTREEDGGGHPILLTAATYPNRMLRVFGAANAPYNAIEEYLKMADIVGLNVYPEVGHMQWGIKLYFRTKPKEMREYFSALVNRIAEKRKKTWVIELQAEPWEPGHLVYKEEEEPRTSGSEETESMVKIFKSMDVNTLFLWGPEYWIFREKSFGDESWYKSLERILKGE